MPKDNDSNIIALSWKRKERKQRAESLPGDLQEQVRKLLALVRDLELTLKIHRRMIRKLTRIMVDKEREHLHESRRGDSDPDKLA